MKKLMIAIDESPCAMKSVEYAAEQFGGNRDIHVSLVHVLPNLPAIFWDEGHILSEREKGDRQKVIDTWVEKQKTRIEPLFGMAKETLTRKGVPRDRITTTFVSDSTDVAESLIETAKDGGYHTIVLGRCGVAQGKRLLAGSVTSKIIHLASGVAVVVVE